jgi:membrane associated rhomboid family serine protease
MLYDRPYMRDDYPGGRTSFLVWLLSATIAGFIIQNVFGVWFHSESYERLTALSAASVRSGFLWTLFTYPLLHDGVLHILCVMLGVFFLGRELLPQLGERRLSWLTLAAIVGGGLAWFALNFNRTGTVVGGTTILVCYLIVFACLFPNREISFLVFFILPITTRPKYIAWVVLGVDLCGFLFSEIPGREFMTPVPYSAHLGAMLVGWLYFRYVHEADWNSFRRRTDIELPRWMKRGVRNAQPTSGLPTNPRRRGDLRAEVDRILDKINSHGFGALTADEKRVLDEAKELLSRR